MSDSIKNGQHMEIRSSTMQWHRSCIGTACHMVYNALDSRLYIQYSSVFKRVQPPLRVHAKRDVLSVADIFILCHKIPDQAEALMDLKWLA